MLAMDVVDTLRHREQLVLGELDTAARRAALLARLREIYSAQGIEVSEQVLEEGVRALEERRFVYQPPKPSIAVSLARIYVSRGRWLRSALISLLILGAGASAWQLGVVIPGQERDAGIRLALSQTLPMEAARLHEEVRLQALEETARLKADALRRLAERAIADADVGAARAAVSELSLLQQDLMAVYDVRVVYGPQEALSGVFRIPEAVPGGRNFYLIVEAVDPSGRLVEVPVSSEEDRRSARVTRWGQRVSESVFRSVAEDKGDDQIIQNAVIGRKLAGYLAPDYLVETPGGQILEW